MDKILPLVTEGLIRVTDKINFTELGEDNLDTFYPEGKDPVEELCEFLEEHGQKWQKEITEQAEVKMAERKAREEARKAKKDQSSEWDSNDDSNI